MRDYKKMQKVLDSAVFEMQGAAEIYHYRKHWGDKFCCDQVCDSFKKTMDYLKDFDFKALSKDELIAIGFRMWDENVLLCPIWAVDLLLLECADKDIRCGCVAYGWKVKDDVVLWDEKSGIS